MIGRVRCSEHNGGNKRNCSQSVWRRSDFNARVDPGHDDAPIAEREKHAEPFPFHPFASLAGACRVRRPGIARKKAREKRRGDAGTRNRTCAPLVNGEARPADAPINRKRLYIYAHNRLPRNLSENGSKYSPVTRATFRALAREITSNFVENVKRNTLRFL